ncbi:MAG: hypothetical protein ACFB22_05740 [Rhodothalassiaceae bacterium]
MATDFSALDALYPLPPSDLSRQWLICETPAVAPADWPKRRIGDWTLAAHPDTRLAVLTNSHGEPIGWVIDALAAFGPQSGEAEAASLTIQGATEPDIESALYGRDGGGRSDGTGLIGGNWTAILADPRARSDTQAVGPRVYLGAGHSLIYSPAHRIIATSHNLIPDVRRDEALSRAVDPLTTGRFYCFGQTPFLGLKRLLPNHFLDLTRFQSQRHWPKAALAPRLDGPLAAARLVDHAHQILDRLSRDYPGFQLPLSAGRDSRAVLACLRPIVSRHPERIEAFTSRMGDRVSRIDAQIACRLARLAGLQHKVQQTAPAKADPAAVARAFVRIGEAKAGKILAAAGKAKAAPGPARVALPGMAGEVARAFYWHKVSPGPEHIQAPAMARRLQLPDLPSVLDAAQAWLDGLPQAVRDRPADVLDLAYVEMRLGCWDATSRYLFPGAQKAHLSVMATTLAIDTMMHLPQAYRQAGRFQEDMIAYGWPALGALPYNQPIGALRTRLAAEDLAHRARRKLRGVINSVRPDRPLAGRGTA